MTKDLLCQKFAGKLSLYVFVFALNIHEKQLYLTLVKEYRLKADDEDIHSVTCAIHVHQDNFE